MITCGCKLRALFGDVLELRIALWLRAVRLGTPCIGFGRVAQLAQQARHCGAAGRVSCDGKLMAQMMQRTALGFGGPTHRVTRCLAFEQLLQGPWEFRILDLSGGTATTGDAHALGGALNKPGLELATAAPDGMGAQARDLGKPLSATPADPHRLKRDKPPALLFVEPAGKQVDLPMKHAVRMGLARVTLGASTRMKGG